MVRKVGTNQLTNLVPIRLTEARKARGYTMTELAKAIDVTRQAISQYESGQNPSGEVLAKIIDVLNFPISFFTEPNNTLREHSAPVFFRSYAAATKKVRGMGEIRLHWLQRIRLFLEQYFDLPQVNFPNIPELETTDFEQFDTDLIEYVAEYVRRFWGLGDGPISDLTLLLEKQGAITSKIALDDYKLDAFSSWIDNRPFIILTKDKGSAVRSRFDAAHELGHLVLHRWVDREQIEEKQTLKLVEKQANRFASAFLLPKGSFPKEVMSTSLAHFITLKRRWRVSIQAMIYRCDDLGLLSENQVLYLRKRLGRKLEPLDGELSPEEPKLLRQAIELLISDGGKTSDSIVNALKLPPKDIEELCNLESGSLSSNGKVIPISIKFIERQARKELSYE